MELFFPYYMPENTPDILDKKRLGKQRSDCKLAMRHLLETKSLETNNPGWKKAPNAEMFRCPGGAEYLLRYAVALCDKCDELGISDDTDFRDWFRYARETLEYIDPNRDFDNAYPWWAGVPEFHASQKMILVSKNVPYYSPRLGVDPPSGEPYRVWPIHAHEWRMKGYGVYEIRRWERERYIFTHPIAESSDRYMILSTKDARGFRVAYLLQSHDAKENQ